MQVVPPKAAARVPVSNVSLAKVPPNGSSMWVWTSMAPGSRTCPTRRSSHRPRPRSPPARSRPGRWSRRPRGRPRRTSRLGHDRAVGDQGAHAASSRVRPRRPMLDRVAVHRSEAAGPGGGTTPASDGARSAERRRSADPELGRQEAVTPTCTTSERGAGDGCHRGQKAMAETNRSRRRFALRQARPSLRTDHDDGTG